MADCAKSGPELEHPGDMTVSRPDLGAKRDGLMPDSFAKGMTFYTDEQRDLSPELDEFQFDLLQRYLGRHVLEVGAGGGRLTHLVAQRLAPEEFVAIEPSRHFFSILSSRFPDSRPVKLLDCTAKDIRSEYAEHFDSVFSVHVMEHIENDREFLDDCLCLTRQGGLVIALVPALQFLYSDLDRNIGHYRRYDKRMIRTLVSTLPATIEKLQYNNFPGIIASAYFIKYKKLNYQENEVTRTRFFHLAKAYSRYVIPVVTALERLVPPPIGLNLTIVLRKRPTLELDRRTQET
jgi:phospholipid N-methyltransferase